MSQNQKYNTYWIAALVFMAMILRFLTNGKYGFHRDEFLYIAQGQQLDWGFWSNPPAPAFFSWLTQMTVGDSLFAIRLMPSLLGGLTVYLVCLMSREMGGGLLAQMLAGISVICSNAMPRVFLMFNPVPFDVFYWTLFAFLILKYINTDQLRFIYLLALAIAAGFLNKYSVIFFVLALFAAMLLTRHRKLFLNKHFYLAIGITTLPLMPNLWWQWEHNLPVIGHMTTLQRTQLANVRTMDFLKDQLLFNSSVLLIWVAGLWYLLVNKYGRQFRLLGYIFISILLLMIVLKGKSYYTLGAYPMLFAAGACIWERWSAHRRWIIAIPVTAMFLIFGFTLPFSVPYLPLEKMVTFGEKVSKQGLDGLLRWEDGLVHHLPQDYADMLGWKELAEIAQLAVKSTGNPEHCLVYAENFGQAGAIQYFAGDRFPPVYSFADAFAFWAPKDIGDEIEFFVYINDELGEDVQNLFSKITEVGSVQQRYARERGTSVYLCSDPRVDFATFWSSRVEEVREARNLPQGIRLHK